MLKSSKYVLVAALTASSFALTLPSFAQSTTPPIPEPNGPARAFGPNDIPQPNGPALSFSPKDIPEPNGPALVPAQATSPTVPSTTPSTTPSVTPTTPSTMPSSSTVTLTDDQAKSWIDKAVYSSDGKKIGEVAAFARDGSGKVTEMHADIGGFLGIGETRIRLTPTQFSMGPDRVNLMVTSDQAKTLPKIAK